MKKRLWLWSGGVLLFGLLLGAAALRNSQDGKAPAPTRPDFDVGIPTAQEVRAMLGVYGGRVESTERELVTLKSELGETRKQLQESIQSMGKERAKEMGTLEELVRSMQGRSAQDKPEHPRSARFRTFEFDPPSQKGLVVPAGSFGEATLLTGVYAPTGGDPLPVLLKLDAALVGPSRSRVPIRDAFLVGKAQGDANSKRAVVQLQTLSVVTEEGESMESRINGWVIDDDGIQGLAGSYVWRADEILALSGISGALSSGADALAAREATSQLGPVGTVVTAVTGDPLRFAGQRSLSAAFGKMSEILGSRLQEIVPAIFVTNGKRVTVAFISGTVIANTRKENP